MNYFTAWAKIATTKGHRMLTVTKETKAVLTADKGRVICFVKDAEPSKISVAVHGDRAILTPSQARALAAWLTQTAAEVENTPLSPASRARSDWLTSERKEREEIARGLRAPGRW
jgi:hypothetical protein